MMCASDGTELREPQSSSPLTTEPDESASNESLRRGDIKLESFCRARPDNLVEGDLNRQAVTPSVFAVDQNRVRAYALVDERGVERLATSVLHFDLGHQMGGDRHGSSEGIER
jgi:hypothetical protein